MLLEVPIVDLPPGLAEWLPTLIALVGICASGVCMFLLCLITKTLTTIVALKWLLTSVNPLVDLEQGHMGESLGAEGTGVCK